MQCLSYLFIFNLYTKNRKEFYFNKLYLIYITVIFVYSLYLISFKQYRLMFFDDYLIALDPSKRSAQQINEINRCVTILFSIVFFVISYLIEYFNNLLFL